MPYFSAVEWKGAFEIRGVADGVSACGVSRSLERQFQHHEEAIVVVRGTGVASDKTTRAGKEGGWELSRQRASLFAYDNLLRFPAEETKAVW